MSAGTVLAPAGPVRPHGWRRLAAAVGNLLGAMALVLILPAAVALITGLVQLARHAFG